MVRQFIDDDEGYLRWLAEHPDGFVVNSERRPRPAYLILHSTSCRTITTAPPNGRRWTVDYAKTCGSRAELETWATNEVGGAVKACAFCT